MKLTIKNYDKCIGWAYYGPEKGLTWKIRAVYESDDMYDFGITLMDDNDNFVSASTIHLSRTGYLDSDFKMFYEFLPDNRQRVSAEWFSDMGNAYTAFETEIKKINAKY
jgi:hypothetical protein